VIEEITKGRGNPAGSTKLQTTKWNNDKTNHHARPFPLEINERDRANQTLMRSHTTPKWREIHF
jgi:hypothetical protein